MPSQSNDAGGVAGRYASALYELADQAKCLDAVADDLRALRGLVDENEDFARVVASPVLSRDAQVAAMTELGEKAGFQDLTVKFLGLLARNRRLAALRPAVGAFLAELASRRGQLQLHPYYHNWFGLPLLVRKLAEIDATLAAVGASER